MSAQPLLHDYLIEAAARLPDKVALVCDGERKTYADLEARSNALASALVQRGVRRGDRVVILLDNGVAAVTAFWAALKANAVAVVVNIQVRSDKLAYIVNDCAAAALVSDTRYLPTLGPALPRLTRTPAIILDNTGGPPADLESTAHTTFAAALAEGSLLGRPQRRALDIDLAAIVYTSGSTGEPKGVMLTHRNMLTAATSISSYLGNREDDVILNVLPLAFDYGLYQMLMAARAGARLVLERSFGFPARVMQRVTAEGVTAFPGVPTIFTLLAGMRELDPRDFEGVRYVTNTAAALSPKHIESIRRLFPKARLFSMYGLTECKRCTYLPPEDLERKPGSVGIAIPNTELWLVDEQGRRVGPGEVGQLVIRGATVMKGYWGKPEETAKKLRPGPLPGEQVLYTGDYCRLDEDGYLYFVSRMDDVIKSRGEKVAPKEVELAIAELAGVREVAVIGVDDALLGQAVKAFVVLEPQSSLVERDILAECHRRLEPHLWPKFIELVAELPKTPSGKIDKQSLKRDAATSRQNTA